MFENDIKKLRNMKRMLSTKTDMFLQDGATTLGKILVKYNGMFVIIPLDIPETNETAQNFFSEMIEALKEY